LATDIVERLRALQEISHAPLCGIMEDAADEIERLREQIAEMEEAIAEEKPPMRSATAAEIAEKIESQAGGIQTTNDITECGRRGDN